MTPGPCEPTNASTRLQIGRPASKVTLRSLAPKYVEDQHDVYLRHLKDAVEKLENRNIALTGRYGSGKSSVLDQFEKENTEHTLRISITTLGPDVEDDGLTNRIQKELVKQLIYRAKPGLLRRSRFARSAPLTKSQAAVEATILATTLGGLLYLLGAFPDVSGTGDGHHWAVRIGASVAFAALTVFLIGLARWLIGDRVISQFKTAGTSVSLDTGPDTYFDKYLDEIVTFFDDVEPKYVIFEDLDRFDDPQIFDSLRELNSLINTSANWKDTDQPLRFIYAIKDSLFEKLGERLKTPESSSAFQDDASKAADNTRGAAHPEPEPAQPDAAAAAVERANRTKFFEVVIPVVPFISHRNARDHLLDALKDLGFPEDAVNRKLLDLVARHATEMRLLLNICNEFAVYAEKLLWIPEPAPGMTAEHLFALVAYKNFHLADFEGIPQRTSSLDRLEEQRIELVRYCVQQTQKEKRTLNNTADRQRSQEEIATQLGARLRGIATSLRAVGSRHMVYKVGGEAHSEDGIDTPEFWAEVASQGSLAINQLNPERGLITLTADSLKSVFGEALVPRQWEPLNEGQLSRELLKLDADVTLLQGAGYAELASQDKFKTDAGESFGTIIGNVLDSELARELVKRGFLTHNFAEYSATFYGKFIGTDVAFFYNRSVQPNQVYLDFRFDGPTSVANLLEEAPADFASTRSVFNIDVVSHLLKENHPEAATVSGFIVSEFNSDARAFITAFLNDPEAPGTALIAALTAVPWPDVFEYLAIDDALPNEDTRLKLFDAALIAARSADEYEFGDAPAVYLGENYNQLASFTAEQPTSVAESVFAFTQRAGLTIADLSVVAFNRHLLRRVVDAHAYDLIAPNLRIALGADGPVGVEEVHRIPSVWEYCANSPEAYLATVREDSLTEYSVRTPAALVETLNERFESWPGHQVEELLQLSAPESCLADLNAVPSETWTAVAAARRLQRTVSNLLAYAEKHGVDKHLAGLLAPAGEEPTQIVLRDDDAEEQRVTLAVRLLNADKLADPATRIALIEQLDLPNECLPVSELAPHGPGLLALLLNARLVADDKDTFEHFLGAGWKTAETAFEVSTNIDEFFTPDLISDVAADLLNSRSVPARFKVRVVEELPLFIADDDTSALTAAGKFAAAENMKLPVTEIHRIARATNDVETVTRLLVLNRDSTTEQVVEALAMLGGDFAALMDGPESEFAQPVGPSSVQTLFSRLQRDGRVKLFTKKKRRRVRNLA